MSEVLSKVTCDHIPEGDSCGLVVTLIEQNAKLRELVADMYMRFHGVVIDNWAYSSEDFRMYEQCMRELGIEVDDG